MEVGEIQSQVCKFQRIGNGRSGDSNKLGKNGEDQQYPDDEEDGVLVKRTGSGSGIDIVRSGGVGRLCGWPSSRIVRVSRASGGKDRHCKVVTSKGLRDRRVRLSVTTAIQFYDLQDRLGYDQPSKAVDWLLKAAASSITELPSLTASFPDTTNQLSDEKRSSGDNEYGFESTEVELDDDPNYHHHHQQLQNVSLSKSACSSTSETSKGSGLSLSRSESRIKARERARERAAEKEKEKENESMAVVNDVNPISQNSSFTDLLTGGISRAKNYNMASTNGSAHQNAAGSGDSTLFNRSRGQWTTPMDYLSSGLFGPSSFRSQSSSSFSGQIRLGNSIPQFNVTAGDHYHHHQQPELQHFSFVPENFVPAATSADCGSQNYNLAGFNRGTLQSNSPSLLSHLQRFPPIENGSNLPFFIGTAAPNAVAPMENHHRHQFPSGSDGRLQLYYGDGGRHSDQKGKGKN